MLADLVEFFRFIFRALLIIISLILMFFLVLFILCAVEFMGEGEYGTAFFAALAAIGIISFEILIFKLLRNSKSVLKKYYDRENKVLKKVVSNDSDFSITNFHFYAKNIFSLMQDAWISRDYKKIRLFVSDSLYSNWKSQLTDSQKSENLSKSKRHKVYYSFLYSFSSDNTYEFLSVLVICSPNFTLFNVNKVNSFVMKFARTKGSKSKPNFILPTSNCRNCGAIISIDDNGVCQYCHTSLITKDDDWKLVDIERCQFLV